MYVYVISNPAFPEWLKVGKTKNLHTRMTTLNTATPFEFTIELVEEELPCDKPVHNKLLAMGIESSREWFKTDLDTVERVMADVVAEWAEHD
jgi:hypothetical protein